jgi:hypothetical protein
MRTAKKKLVNRFLEEKYPKGATEKQIKEWKIRFATGHPEDFMDSDSLAIYEKICAKIEFGAKDD